MNHGGTRKCKELLEKHQPAYLTALQRDNNARMTLSVVLLGRRRGILFLQKGNVEGTKAPLREMADAAAQKWVRQRIRRGERAAAGRRAAPEPAARKDRVPWRGGLALQLSVPTPAWETKVAVWPQTAAHAPEEGIKERPQVASNSGHAS